MNKVMKKIIAFLLCIVMLCLALPCVSMAETSYDINEEKQLLEAIGVINSDSEDGSIVTRAEFIKSVLRLKKLDIEAKSYRPIFTDVSEGHWAYSEIISAYQLGYISADKYGKIYPDSPADGAFAVRVIVNALNYGGIAGSLGGDDNSYFKAASIIEVTGGTSITSAAPIERADFIKLLYNALFVPLSETYVEGDTIMFNSSGEKTLLNTVYDIYYTDGIVTADKYITLGLEKYDSVKKFIVLDNVMYNAEVLNTTEIIGCRVKLYYELDDDVKTAVCVIPKNNKIVELKNCDINYSNFKIGAVSRGEDKEKTYTIGINTNIVWNNAIISETEFASEILGLSGELKLIDNNSDGKYDVVIAENQSIVEIYGYDPDIKKLTGADGKVYELERYNNVIYQNADKSISSPLIMQNSKYVSVFVYKNDYHSIVIRECKADIQAVLNEVSVSESFVNLENYGVLYISKKSLIAASELEPGQEYVFSFDCYGDIINATTLNTGSNNLVYMVDSKYEDKLNESLALLVMNLQGEMIKYECADKINVRLSDGTMTSKTRAELDALLTKRQPVLIRFNSKGEINSIFQLASSERDDLFFHEIDYASGLPESERGSLEYQRSRLSFSNAIILRSNAVKMFAVPYAELTSYSQDSFNVITQAQFRSGTTYTIGTNGFRATAICMEANDFICDYMVWEYAQDMNRINSATLSYGIVEKISEAIDPNGDEKGYLMKIGEKEYWFRECTDLNGVNISVGSIVVYASDYSGRPTNDSITVLCDLKIGVIHQQGSLGSYTKNDRFRVAKATLIDKSGSVGKFLVTRSPGTTIVQCYNLSGKKVQIYNKERNVFKTESAVSSLQKGDEVVLGIAVNALGSIYIAK